MQWAGGVVQTPRPRFSPRERRERWQVYRKTWNPCNTRFCDWRASFANVPVTLKHTPTSSPPQTAEHMAYTGLSAAYDRLSDDLEGLLPTDLLKVGGPDVE